MNVNKMEQSQSGISQLDFGCSKQDLALAPNNRLSSLPESQNDLQQKLDTQIPLQRLTDEDVAGLELLSAAQNTQRKLALEKNSHIGSKNETKPESLLRGSKRTTTSENQNQGGSFPVEVSLQGRHSQQSCLAPLGLPQESCPSEQVSPARLLTKGTAQTLNNKTCQDSEADKIFREKAKASMHNTLDVCLPTFPMAESAHTYTDRSIRDCSCKASEDIRPEDLQAENDNNDERLNDSSPASYNQAEAMDEIHDTLDMSHAATLPEAAEENDQPLTYRETLINDPSEIVPDPQQTAPKNTSASAKDSDGRLDSLRTGQPSPFIQGTPSPKRPEQSALESLSYMQTQAMEFGEYQATVVEGNLIVDTLMLDALQGSLPLLFTSILPSQWRYMYSWKRTQFCYQTSLGNADCAILRQKHTSSSLTDLTEM